MSNKPSFLRHSAWVNENSFKDTVLNIVGCGAVGSNAAMLAARMGWTKFQLWDDDIVEDHNLPNQAFFPEHINMPKVEALASQLIKFNPSVKVVTHNKRFTTKEDAQSVEGILFIATDSMKSRSDIYSTFAYNVNIKLVIEARLAFDFAELYVLNPLDYDHLKNWKESLKTDEEIPDGPCNLRLCTTLVMNVCASAIHFACVPYALWRSEKERVLPFRTRFLLTDRLVVKTN